MQQVASYPEVQKALQKVDAYEQDHLAVSDVASILGTPRSNFRLKVSREPGYRVRNYISELPKDDVKQIILDHYPALCGWKSTTELAQEHDLTSKQVAGFLRKETFMVERDWFGKVRLSPDCEQEVGVRLNGINKYNVDSFTQDGVQWYSLNDLASKLADEEFSIHKIRNSLYWLVINDNSNYDYKLISKNKIFVPEDSSQLLIKNYAELRRSQKDIFSENNVDWYSLSSIAKSLIKDFDLIYSEENVIKDLARRVRENSSDLTNQKIFNKIFVTSKAASSLKDKYRIGNLKRQDVIEQDGQTWYSLIKTARDLTNKTHPKSKESDVMVERNYNRFYKWATIDKVVEHLRIDSKVFVPEAEYKYLTNILRVGDEAAKIAGVAKKTLYDWRNKGLLTHHKRPGTSSVIRLDELSDFLTNKLVNEQVVTLLKSSNGSLSFEQKKQMQLLANTESYYWRKQITNFKYSLRAFKSLTDPNISKDEYLMQKLGMNKRQVNTMLMLAKQKAPKTFFSLDKPIKHDSNSTIITLYSADLTDLNSLTQKEYFLEELESTFGHQTSITQEEVVNTDLLLEMNLLDELLKPLDEIEKSVIKSYFGLVDDINLEIKTSELEKIKDASLKKIKTSSLAGLIDRYL